MLLCFQQLRDRVATLRHLRPIEETAALRQFSSARPPRRRQLRLRRLRLHYVFQLRALRIQYVLLRVVPLRAARFLTWLQEQALRVVFAEFLA